MRNAAYLFYAWLTALLLFPCVQSMGQAYKFHRYTIDDGLQNNIVLAAAADAKGLMWFATNTGIDRFDGSNFVHYVLPATPAVNPGAAAVNSLLAAADGSIWSVSGAYLFHYNKRVDSFSIAANVTNWNANSKTITGIFAGKAANEIFVATNNTLYLYNTRTQKPSSPTGFNGFVRFVYQDQEGTVWVSVNKKIEALRVSNGKLVPASGHKLIVPLVNGQPYTIISRDAAGRFWLVNADGYIQIARENAQRALPLSQTTTGKVQHAVKDVYQDVVNKKTLVSFDGGGLAVYGDDLQLQGKYLSNEDDPTTLSNNAVYDIVVDKYKRLWVTTYGGGVNVVTPEVQPFRNINHQINNSNSLVNNAAKAVTSDAAGRLWFGTRKGVSRWDLTTDQWQQFNTETIGAGFSADNILALATASDGNIWAGTYGGGLVMINTKTNGVANLQSIEADSSTLGTNYIYALCADGHGRLWAGGIRGKLSYVDIASKKITRIKTPVSNINCLIENSSGQVLAGTERGIYLVQGDSLVPFLNAPLQDKVMFLLQDADASYWVGTSGAGVIHLEASGKELKRITTADGLPSNVICGIIKDDFGDYWIGTSNGLAHWQSRSNRVTYYTKADGLAGSQVNYGAMYKMASNQIVVGTTDGFSMFNPRNIVNKGYKPSIVLTGLTVNNKRMVPGAEESPLQQQLDELDKISLRYFENSFAVDFVNVSPALSGKHLYSWKLEGFDKNWSVPSTNATAVYTNLRPGTYKLLIKAIAKGATDNGVVRALMIKIHYPWWLTIWAFIGYVLILTAGILLIYNYLKEYYARKKFAERLRLNTSISHEIRTPLTLIKGPVNALASAQGISDSDRENLSLAQKNIQKLEAIISQFIDFQKSANVKMQMQVSRQNLVQLVQEKIASFRPLAQEKEIDLKFSTSQEKILLLYDRDKMEKVLNNLLSNAVKYTPQGKSIEVSVRCDIKNVFISITDTGIGIPRDQQQFLFKGYFRADNTVNLKETGSGIGLQLTKDLVEMHYGKLSFQSAEGQGTTFTVKLPLQQPALHPYIIKQDANAEGGDVLPPLASKAAPKPQNKLLLLAEDNDELRAYMQGQLEGAGYKVIAAADGKEALALAGGHQPDLVITDVMMPHMNGFQFCSALKRDIATSHIPVIMLTAIHDRDYLLEGYRSGADDYVKKPFDVAHILVRIENLLQNRLRFRNKMLSVFEQGEQDAPLDTEMQWLRSTTTLIADNLSEPDFSVDKLGTLMAMSRPALFRKFKSITGESPQQYIQQIKMRRAIELLQAGQMNINEVAFECGFSDPKYFSTSFKKFYGKTPSEYIQQLPA